MSQAGQFLPATILPLVETLTGNSGGPVGPTLGNINIVGADGVDVVGDPGTSTLTITADTTMIEYVSIDHADSPYTALTTDYYISADVTAGVITINLPNAPATGRVYIVKDQVGLAPKYIISVSTPGGTVTFDGVTTFMMNTAFETAQFVFNGVGYEVF
jgi:hypothetical protein